MSHPGGQVIVIPLTAPPLTPTTFLGSNKFVMIISNPRARVVANNTKPKISLHLTHAPIREPSPRMDYRNHVLFWSLLRASETGAGPTSLRARNYPKRLGDLFSTTVSAGATALF